MTTLAGRRVVFGAVGSAGLSVDGDLRAPFVVLVPALVPAGDSVVVAVAAALVSRGCVEFCCVGPHAAALEDRLDASLESDGSLSVVTTSGTDEVEMCWYARFVAASGTGDLLALVDRHSPLATRLLQSR